MSQALQQQQPLAPAVIEKLVTGGDLSQMNPQQRTSYYLGLCKSLGLNPALQPFEYVKLSGKLVLYAKKNCADQLRQLRGVSIYKIEEREIGEGKDITLIVTAYARDEQGREDVDQGVVSLKGKSGDDLANARMKAVTKAKRRVTLSLCGLGMMDESELETVRGAQAVGNGQWQCLPDTVAEMLDACNKAVERGVTQAELVGMLPTGKTSRQQLNETEAGLFIQAVQNFRK